MLKNLVRVTSATTGTGTITLGSAVAGALSFSEASVPDGAVVSYGISDGSESEVGRGTYASGAGTLTRDIVLASTNSGNKIVLSGNEQVYITSLAEDIASIDAVLASDHSSTGIKTRFKANEAQAFGDLCFINADGEAQLADADAIATSCVVAMCADASISANAYGNYLLVGTARDDSWNWTVGGFAGMIFLSTTGTTGNTMTQTAPSGTNDVIQPIGYALSADSIFFNPSMIQIEHT
jgi:hypothetical protein